MPQTIRPGTEIVDFWPENSKDTLYLVSPVNLLDLQNEITKHFGPTFLEDIQIESKCIHTYCVTYDLHCPEDYTDFIVVTLK